MNVYMLQPIRPKIKWFSFALYLILSFWLLLKHDEHNGVECTKIASVARCGVSACHAAGLDFIPGLVEFYNRNPRKPDGLSVKNCEKFCIGKINMEVIHRH